MMEGTNQPQISRRDALRVAAGFCGLTLLAAGARTDGPAQVALAQLRVVRRKSALTIG
ncbi:MAG: hypothetical protein ACYYNF_08155 [Actinomycetes bacterium]